MTDFIYQNSDNLIGITGLTNISTGAYVNNATVTYTLYDSAGNSLATGSESYVSASNGNYQATLSGSGLIVGQHYQIVHVANSGQATIIDNVVCIINTGNNSTC